MRRDVTEIWKESKTSKDITDITDFIIFHNLKLTTFIFFFVFPLVHASVLPPRAQEYPPVFLLL